MSGAQGFPNPNSEKLQPDTTIQGTHTLVQPFLVIGINHKNVVTAPSHVVHSCAGFKFLHALVNLLIYRRAKVHTHGPSISLWHTSWFKQHTISLSVNQSRSPKGVVSLGRVLGVRLLEVGGSIGGALGKAFFPFTFGMALGKAWIESGLRIPNPNSRCQATKHALRVPNPNSRGHATKRALQAQNPNSRGQATKRGL